MPAKNKNEIGKNNVLPPPYMRNFDWLHLPEHLLHLLEHSYDPNIRELGQVQFL
jgi:hypothetical protein